MKENFDKSKNNNKRRSWMTLLGIIAIIAIIVVNIIMWKNYFAEKSQIDVLKNEVELAVRQASQVAEPPTGLETQLLEVQNNLNTALKVFPANVDRNDVVDFVLTTANECHVQMIPLIADGWQTESKGHSYVVLRYHGTVTGNLVNASNFITLLRNSDYPTMIITECNIERETGLITNIPDNNIEVSIELSIALYTNSIRVDKDITS